MDPHDLPTERWCAGLRSAGPRPLATDERERIAARRRLLRGLAGVESAGFVAAALVPFVIAVWFPHAASAAVAIGIYLLVFVALGIPVFLKHQLEHWSAHRALGRDLRSGEAERFDGTLIPGEPLDPDQRWLIAARLLVAGDAPARLDVLAHSRLVLTVDDRAIRLFRSVTIGEVAPGPSYAMRVPLATGVDPGSEREVAFFRRTLSEAERAEIERLVRRLARFGIVPGLVVAWFGCGAWITLSGGPGAWAKRDLPIAILEGTIALLVVGVYLRRYLASRALRHDTATGWALTPQVRSGEGDATAAPASIEFLPHSKLVWTEGGKPARWRRRSAAG